MSQTGKAIYSLLTADSTVNTNTGGRIREGLLAQGDTYPAIVFTLVTADANWAKGDTSQVDIENYEVSILAETWDDAYTIADAARLALEAAGEQTVAGVDLDGIMRTNETSVPYNDETDIVHIAQDYEIRIKV